MDWNSLKEKGNPFYKSGEVEPIDLYKSGGLLRDFALASIMKYAYRNRRDARRSLNVKDLHKIIHYAEMLILMELEKSSPPKEVKDA
jgi:hypothetical protein